MEKLTVSRLEWILSKNDEQIRAFDNKASFIMFSYFGLLGILIALEDFLYPVLYIVFISLVFIQISLLIAALSPRSKRKAVFDLKSVIYFNSISTKYSNKKDKLYKDYLKDLSSNNDEIYEDSLAMSILSTSDICRRKEKLIKLATFNLL